MTQTQGALHKSHIQLVSNAQKVERIYLEPQVTSLSRSPEQFIQHLSPVILHSNDGERKAQACYSRTHQLQKIWLLL